MRTRSTILRYGKIISVNLLILTVLLLMAEGIYRAVQPDAEFYSRTFPGQSENRPPTWSRPDKDLGWVFSGSNLHTFTGNDRPWTASVNQEGFRATFDYVGKGPKNGIERIMMLGDSFLFGPYLNESETLSGLLQEQLGRDYEVYNFGIPGWGVDQMYLAYKKYVDAVDPDVVVVVYIDEDVLRVFEAFRNREGMTKPSFKLVRGRLTHRDGDKPGLLEWLAETSLMANRFYESVYRHRESARVARALFLEFAQDARQRGHKLTVIRYPANSEILENRRELSFDVEKYLRGSDVLYLDPADEMRAAGAARYKDFYLPGNDHPTMEGNEFVARYLASKLVLR